MGFMDKLKGLLKGKESQVKGGIDTVSNKVEGAVGEKHAAKVDDVSQKAKDAVDNLTKDDAPSPAPAGPPPAAPAAPTTPPARRPGRPGRPGRPAADALTPDATKGRDPRSRPFAVRRAASSEQRGGPALGPVSRCR